MIQTKIKYKDFVTVVSLLFWAAIIYYAVSPKMPREQFGVLFLGGITIIYAINEIGKSISDNGWLDVSVLSISIGIITVTTGHLFLNYTELNQERLGYFYNFEYILASLFLLVIIYFTYREFGRLFLGLVVGGLLYGYFGPYFPGLLGHSGMSVERLLQIWVLNYSGVIGFLTRLVAAWVALFLLYAGLLQGYDAFDLILRIAARAGKYIQSGVAQSAVISSMIIGSINGSSAANTAITGSFTIPLMKEGGLEPETAGGIESIASTTGQVLPPVMGASAFIMASLLGIQYIDVILAGIIPAFAMVLSIFVGVHYIGVRELDERTIDIEEQGVEPRSQRKLALDGVVFGVPFLILIYTLGILQWTVMTSALYTCLAMIGTGVTGLLIESDKEIQDVRTVVRKTSNGFRHGALVLAPIAIILAAINGLVDMFLATGVPSAVTLSIINISGGSIIVASILAMVVCIILGLGMPTAASYVIVALLVAPTLIGQFMVPELAAHYFVFYSAILAAITPPIATGIAVATGIAGSNFWGTAKMALKISIPLFILPYTFIMHPGIVSGEFSTGILVTGILVSIGAVTIIHGLNYGRESDITMAPNYSLRSLYLGLGLITMLHTDFLIGTIAAMISALLVLVQNKYGNPFALIIAKSSGRPAR